jgi:glycolate oxidase
VDILDRARAVVGEEHVMVPGGAHEVPDDYRHDEALTARPVDPLALLRPRSTEEVAALLRLAHDERVPVVARGSGTGLSGGSVPVAGGLLIAFDRMDEIREIDTANHVAVVEPGVTLSRLDQELAPLGLTYPVSPGEMSASIGGTVATNAGGMRAIRYGVTRHHVLGLEVVLPGGEVMRTGGKFVKSSSGYDLTQLLIGSEGTLALVTEVTLKLHPRLGHSATVLAPFPSLHAIGAAVPQIVTSGLAPSILEYLDAVTMAGITASARIELGVEEAITSQASAYLVVLLEGDEATEVDADAEKLGELLTSLGALDVFVLPPRAGAQLIEARERAFFVAKAAGADDIVDTVVPRACIPDFLQQVGALGERHGALVTGCGHVGDGNVHLSVFQPDTERRKSLLEQIFATAARSGGAVSGEHGIGTEKRSYFLAHEDPVKLNLQRRLKTLFDPRAILAPGHLLDEVPTATATVTVTATAAAAAPAAAAP